MDEKTIEAIDQSSKNIRKKYLLLKKGLADQESFLSTTFKPITDPLNSILETKNAFIQPAEEMNTKTFESDDESSNDDRFESKKANDLFIKYLNKVRDNNSKWDKTFGINVNNDQMFLGNSQLRQIGANIRVGNSEPVKVTSGLLELLFFKKPDSSLVSRVDVSNYKKLLETSGAHKCTRFNRLKCSKSFKYNEVIKKMFQSHPIGASITEDKNKIKTFADEVKNMRPSANNSDTVYFDDPNEIVDRLRLLIASREAGNNGHTNEILSIIEELKELKIIK